MYFDVQDYEGKVVGQALRLAEVKPTLEEARHGYAGRPMAVFAIDECSGDVIGCISDNRFEDLVDEHSPEDLIYANFAQ